MADTDLKALHNQARMVASLMDGWRYDEAGSKNADGELHWSARLTDGTHALLLSTRGYGADADMLTIRADLPTRSAAGEYVQADGTVPSIRCHSSRPAKAIAAEISRRLLPEIKTAHEAQAARIASQDAYEAQRAATVAALLAGEIGASHPSGRRDGVVYLDFADHDRVYGDVKVSGNSCRLEISGLTAQQVIEMVKIARRG